MQAKLRFIISICIFCCTSSIPCMPKIRVDYTLSAALSMHFHLIRLSRLITTRSGVLAQLLSRSKGESNNKTLGHQYWEVLANWTRYQTRTQVVSGNFWTLIPNLVFYNLCQVCLVSTDLQGHRSFTLLQTTHSYGMQRSHMRVCTVNSSVFIRCIHCNPG